MIQYQLTLEASPGHCFCYRRGGACSHHSSCCQGYRI